MARIDRARLDSGIFPVRLVIQTRFDDLDFQGHINNVAVVVLLQEARVDFNRQAGLRGDMAGLRMMAAGLTVEYAGELRYPEPVEAVSGVLAIGRTSFTLGQVLLQKDLPKTYSEATLVFADDSGPAAIPDSIRRRLESLLLKVAA